MNPHVLTLFFDPALITDRTGAVQDFNPECARRFPRLAKGSALGTIFGQGQASNLMAQLEAKTQPIQCSIKLDGPHEINAMLRAMKTADDLRLLVLHIPPVCDGQSEEGDDLALRDPLTGLANRILLLQQTREALSKTLTQGGFTSFLFMDLDAFKPVNDTYGHECGDHVLIILAERIKTVVRDHDLVSRIGGDEFVVLLTGLQNGMHAGLTATRLIKAISEPIPWEGIKITVGVSIGISVAPTDSEDPIELLNKADQAMYVAKRSGKNNYSFWNEAAYFI
ncbi:MAG: GGDEF domain-containing protein [Deltaproteobacteria bacterium]|nr:GGDEF domain-containing protein [Deltaproteobacteria bacterium]